MSDAGDIVCPMTKERLPLEPSQMVCVLRANAPGAGRLQIVHEHGDLQGRVDVNQQMHMIRLAAKLSAKNSRRSANIRGVMAWRRIVTTACDEEWKSCLLMVGSVS